MRGKPPPKPEPAAPVAEPRVCPGCGAELVPIQKVSAQLELLGGEKEYELKADGKAEAAWECPDCDGDS